MKFQELIEFEAVNSGTKFVRTDLREQGWKWYIWFDPEEAGRLRHTQMSNGAPPSDVIELYHHDFKDEEWDIYIPLL